MKVSDRTQNQLPRSSKVKQLNTSSSKLSESCVRCFRKYHTICSILDRAYRFALVALGCRPLCGFLTIYSRFPRVCTRGFMLLPATRAQGNRKRTFENKGGGKCCGCCHLAWDFVQPGPDNALFFRGENEIFREGNEILREGIHFLRDGHHILR